MGKLGERSDGAVSHCNDDSFEFTPYEKGESVYDQSHKWKAVR